VVKDLSAKKLFRNYKEVRRSYNCLFKNIKFCLETLIECVQGPCVENQVIILDSSFQMIVEVILDLEYQPLIPDNTSISEKVKPAKFFNFQIQQIQANVFMLI